MSPQSFAISLSRQRWLPYKTRRSLIKRLHPKMLKHFPFEAPFFAPGLKFRGNIINYIDRLVYFCGAHEKYMLCFLRDYARQLNYPPVFVDIGANAGNHVLFMATIAAEVHAFEPYERVRKQMEDNLMLNGLRNVRIYPFGLSDKDAVMPFYAAPDSNLGAASFVAEHKSDNYYLGDMELKRGDDLLQGIKVDIIKADIEGFEKFALQGLQETLKRNRPLVVMELSPTTRETLGSEAALHALFPPNYRFYYFSKGKLDSGAYRLAPFDYALMPKIQDVIACPEEKLICRGSIYK